MITAIFFFKPTTALHSENTDNPIVKKMSFLNVFMYWFIQNEGIILGHFHNQFLNNYDIKYVIGVKGLGWSGWEGEMSSSLSMKYPI